MIAELYRLPSAPRAYLLDAIQLSGQDAISELLGNDYILMYFPFDVCDNTEFACPWIEFERD
jgi:hypothetical protein